MTTHRQADVCSKKDNAEKRRGRCENNVHPEVTVHHIAPQKVAFILHAKHLKLGYNADERSMLNVECWTRDTPVTTCWSHSEQCHLNGVVNEREDEKAPKEPVKLGDGICVLGLEVRKNARPHVHAFVEPSFHHAGTRFALFYHKRLNSPSFLGPGVSPKMCRTTIEVLCYLCTNHQTAGDDPVVTMGILNAVCSRLKP
jgi:hypothetical protein